MRSLVERLTHRVVFRRRLPAELGRLPIYVSTEAGLRYLMPWTRKIDPLLLDLARQTVRSRASRRSTNYLLGCGTTQAGGWRERQLAPALTLDSLLARFLPPDVIKIDVEGAEHLVLEGARELLRTSRPTLICEVAGAQGPHRLVQRAQLVGWPWADAASRSSRPTSSSTP